MALSVLAAADKKKSVSLIQWGLNGKMSFYVSILHNRHHVLQNVLNKKFENGEKKQKKLLTFVSHGGLAGPRAVFI